MSTSHTQKDRRTLEELVSVLTDIGVIDHHWHSRWRVYPQDVGATVQLQAAASANVFGSWAKIIPEDTIPFEFEIVGLVIEELSATTTYHIQIGYNPRAGEPGENQEMGERRMRFATVPVSRITEILEIRSQDMPANSSVWGRVKTAGGASETVNLSVILTRHIEVKGKEPMWPAFPW